MSRKFWVVLSPDTAQYREETDRGRLTTTNDNYGIFFNEQHARAYAVKLSKQNPGFEIQIAEAKNGFHSPPPQSITEKVWQTNGEYIPL